MLLWKHRNIEARIWSLEHCPPHVTFVCRADQWTARVGFSMVGTDTELIDVKPVGNAPAPGLLQQLVQQVNSAKQGCRQAWWDVVETACLDNQPVLWDLDRVRLAAADEGTGVVVARRARYDAGTGVVAQIKWNDGSTSRNRIEE